MQAGSFFSAPYLKRTGQKARMRTHLAQLRVLTTAQQAFSPKEEVPESAPALPACVSSGIGPG